jgi:hypothetical protein
MIAVTRMLLLLIHSRHYRRRRDSVLAHRQIYPRWTARKFAQDFGSFAVPGGHPAAIVADARDWNLMFGANNVRQPAASLKRCGDE